MLNNQGYVSECTGDNVFFVETNRDATRERRRSQRRDARSGDGDRSETNVCRMVEQLFRPAALKPTAGDLFTGTAAEVIPGHALLITEESRQPVDITASHPPL